MRIELNKNAEKLINILCNSGYKAYAVGGCVRDSILCRAVTDVDITTSAKPEETEALLNKNNIKFFETGLKHGTITAVIDGENFEITTFRTETTYMDNRHPDKVNFVSDVKDDLSRRDFTVNAIAYNDKEGIIDLFGGKEDIEKKLIRAVGKADTRFKEDALRIMRALRFSAVLGFEIEEDTQKAIFNNKELLQNIAGERIFVELKKLLLGKYCENLLIKYREVLAVVIPELQACFDFEQNSKWHLYDVYTHSVKSVSISPEKDYMRFSLLLHDIGKPYCKTTDEYGQDHFKGHPEIGAELAEKALSRFNPSNVFKYKVLTLISNHDCFITRKRSNIKKWLRILDEELTFDYIDLKIADLKTHNLELSQHEIDELYYIKELTKEVIESGEPYKISDLKINGFDLWKIGYKGAEISNELERLIIEVSGNPELNKKDKLLHLAEQDYKKELS